MQELLRALHWWRRAFWLFLSVDNYKDCKSAALLCFFLCFFSITTYVCNYFSKMKVTEHIQEAKGTAISFEILPPLKGKTIESIYNNLDQLMEFKPAFINVTYHRSEQVFKKRADGTFEKIEVRKRPGTVGICAAIMNHYKVDAVPHLIC